MRRGLLFSILAALGASTPLHAVAAGAAPSGLTLLRDVVTAAIFPNARIVKAKPSFGFKVDGLPPGYVAISVRYACWNVTPAGFADQRRKASAKTWHAKPYIVAGTCKPENEAFRKLGILTCAVACR